MLLKRSAPGPTILVCALALGLSSTAATPLAQAAETKMAQVKAPCAVGPGCSTNMATGSFGDLSKGLTNSFRKLTGGTPDSQTAAAGTPAKTAPPNAQCVAGPTPCPSPATPSSFGGISKGGANLFRKLSGSPPATQTVGAGTEAKTAPSKVQCVAGPAPCPTAATANSFDGMSKGITNSFHKLTGTPPDSQTVAVGTQTK